MAVNITAPASTEIPTEGLPPGWGEGKAGKLAFLIAIAFSAFQLVIAAYEGGLIAASGEWPER